MTYETMQRLRKVSEILLPLVGYTVTTKDVVLCVINPEEVIEALAAEIERAEVAARQKSYEAVRAIHMAHDWNETSEDLKQWLTSELHDIQRIQPKIEGTK